MLRNFGDEGHLARFLYFGPFLPKEASTLEIPTVMASRNVGYPIYILLHLSIYLWAPGWRSFRTLQKFRLGFSMIVDSPCDGLIDIGVELMHDNSDDIMEIVSSCLLLVVRNDILDYT